MGEGQIAKNNKRIRILIVDDSLTVREALYKMLSTDEEIEVVGLAANGKEAVNLTARMSPDIVTMDIEMPEMDGFGAIELIMGYHPVPIVVLTSSFPRRGQGFVYKALELGALAVIGKPKNLSDLGNDFIGELKLLSKASVITHLRGRKMARIENETTPAEKKSEISKVVGIVCSTGGPGALERILSSLTPKLTAGIVIVQHLAEGFEDEIIGWLNETSGIVVKKAVQGDRIKSGVAYLAPPGLHTVVNKLGTIELINSPPVLGHRPSGDILLSSLSKSYGSRAVGVILTGMGKDGAQGMKAVKTAGGVTIAQDEETSLIFGMPEAAIEMGGVDKIVPLNSIADAIMKGLQPLWI